MAVRTQCGNLDILLVGEYAVVFDSRTQGTYIVLLDNSAGAKSPVAQAAEAVTTGKADPISLPPGDPLKYRIENLIRR